MDGVHKRLNMPTRAATKTSLNRIKLNRHAGYFGDCAVHRFFLPFFLFLVLLAALVFWFPALLAADWGGVSSDAIPNLARCSSSDNSSGCVDPVAVAADAAAAFLARLFSSRIWVAVRPVGWGITSVPAAWSARKVGADSW